MQPLLRTALVLALYSALAANAGSSARSILIVDRSEQGQRALGNSILDESPCPPATIPDGNVCVPVPDPNEGGGPLDTKIYGNEDNFGVWTEYGQIPRRPDRPKGYWAYRLPVDLLPDQSLPQDGQDLDLPSPMQRRDRGLHADGHGGIDVAQLRGARVKLVPLEHQQGNAELLYAGPLFGNTAVTLHQLKQGSSLREYLVLYGNLERIALGLRRGTSLPDGTVLGYVGDSESPGKVHLHLEVRRVRQGVEAKKLSSTEMVDAARTIVCDPRNVLSIAATAAPGAR